MRYRHPHGHAYVDAAAPRAWATCDACGFLFNLENLDFERQWEGPQLVNQHFLVCWRCKDKPQEQFRTIVPPADPEDIRDPRPDIYVGQDDP